MPSGGEAKAVDYFPLNLNWKTSGEWFLAAYGAFLARRRTHAAGDIVRFLSIETDLLLFVSFGFCG
jgi:hypothetical protein